MNINGNTTKPCYKCRYGINLNKNSNREPIYGCGNEPGKPCPTLETELAKTDYGERFLNRFVNGR